MERSKPLIIPMQQKLQLSEGQSPTIEAGKKYVDSIPYASAVGSVMYMMICSEPDLAYSISITSRFMSNPEVAHWDALKGILQYLKASEGVGLLFKKEKIDAKQALYRFVNSYFSSSVDTRRLQSGFAFKLFGITVVRKSLLQVVVTLYITEAEFLAITQAIKGVQLK